LIGGAGYHQRNSLSNTEKHGRETQYLSGWAYGCRQKHYWSTVSSATQYGVFDSDHEIERRTGADVGWVFDLEGEDGFRDREEKVINELTEKQGIVLATGGGSVKSRETRNRLSARGVVVYLETTIEKQLARTQRDKKRPLLQVSAPPREVLEALARERNPLYEEIADVTIRTDDQSAKVVANQIINMLESN
jgi:shikimate kinase